MVEEGGAKKCDVQQNRDSGSRERDRCLGRVLFVSTAFRCTLFDKGKCPISIVLIKRDYIIVINILDIMPDWLNFAVHLTIFAGITLEDSDASHFHL